MSWQPEFADAEIIDLQARLFEGLGHPTRLQLIQTLIEADDSIPVSEICNRTGLSLPLASYHLQRLNRCGLVTTDQQGRHIYYQCISPAVEDLL